MSTLGDVTAQKVDQGGPPDVGEFTYVDISSIDNKQKRIVEPKRLPVDAAPSRARQRLKAGDVLVSMTRPNLNAVAIVPSALDGAVGSTGFHVLRAHEGVEPRWLFNAVQTRDFVETMSSIVQGALYPAVRPKDIRGFEIHLPPIEDQRRIVAEIEKQFSRLDEAVANLKRVKANLKRYKAAVLKAAVEGRLVPTEAELARSEGRNYETGAQLLQRILETRRSQGKGKGKYREPSAPDTMDPAGLPGGWVWASTDQLLAHLTDGDHQAPPQTEQGIPFLVIGNVRTGEIDFTNSRFVGEAYYKSLDQFRQPEQGDLLYTLVGSYGIPVRVKTNRPFCIQRHMAILRPHKYSPMAYLTHAMAADNVFRQASAIATGTAQMTVPLAGLRKIGIPLPPPAEQYRIVAEVDRRLSVVREVESEVEANLKRADGLRQATLQGAFGSNAASD